MILTVQTTVINKAKHSDSFSVAASLHYKAACVGGVKPHYE